VAGTDASRQCTKAWDLTCTHQRRWTQPCWTPARPAAPPRRRCSARSGAARPSALSPHLCCRRTHPARLPPPATALAGHSLPAATWPGPAEVPEVREAEARPSSRVAHLFIHVREQSPESGERCGGHHIRPALAACPRPAGRRADAQLLRLPEPLAVAVLGGLRGLEEAFGTDARGVVRCHRHQRPPCGRWRPASACAPPRRAPQWAGAALFAWCVRQSLPEGRAAARSQCDAMPLALGSVVNDQLQCRLCSRITAREHRDLLLSSHWPRGSSIALQPRQACH